MQSPSSSPDNSPREIHIQESVPLPSHFDLSQWTQDQLKFYFEKDERSKIIQQSVESSFHIPQGSQSYSIDSPWYDHQNQQVVYRIYDSRPADVAFPDVVSVPVKVDDKGCICSTPQPVVLRSDESAQTRSKKINEVLQPGFKRDLDL